MKAKESLNKWEHQDAVKVAEMMIKEYGQPDEVTQTMLKWNKLGDFGPGEQESYIVDESIPHAFPEPHRDFLYTAKKIKVPTRVGDTLLHVTGSIIVDGLKGTVTARCGSLNANALTLGFVEDLAKGKLANNKASAKKEYAKRIKEGPLPSWYTDKLKKHMPKDQQESIHACGCFISEEERPHSRIPTPGATYRSKGSRIKYKFRTKGEIGDRTNPQVSAKPDEYRLDRLTGSGRYKPGHSSYIKKKTMSDRLKSGEMVRENLMLTYQFVKRLTTPFNEWASYGTGVHDEAGNLLVLEGQRTEQQEQSFNKFDLISLRLKKILESIPEGNTRLASYAAAMMIIKERWEDKSESDILSESSQTYIDYLRMYKLDTYNRALEEMPTVSMGSGAIAGGGINGPDDVKVSKKARKKYKSSNKEEAENYHMGIQAYVNSKFNGMF